MSFTSKKLSQPDRLCIRLAAARDAANLSITQVAEMLRVSKETVHALETCDFDALPGTTMYHKKLIRAYCKAIGADPSLYVRQFVCEEEQSMQQKTTEKKTSKFLTFGPYMPSVIKASAFVTTIALVFTYLGLQIHQIVKPPELIVLGPDDGHISNDGHVVIEGIADSESQVDINGKQIMNSEDGHFSEDIILAEGVNTITVSAKKKHGKATTFTRHIMYKKQNQLSLEESVDANDTL